MGGTFRRVAATGVVALFIGTGAAFATGMMDAPGADGVIHGCYGAVTGHLRIVADASECRRFERPISWNQAGPPGGARAYGEITAQGFAYWRRNFNIVAVDHLETGVYCVYVDPSIDTETVVAHATAVGGSAEPRYATAFVGCGLPDHNGIQVNLWNAADERIDSAFYISVP